MNLLYKAAIFDLDGTLLDTLYDLADSVNLVLRDFGYPTYTYQQYRLKIGNGARSLIEKSLPDNLPAEKIDDALMLYKKIYAQRFMIKTRPYGEVTDLVKILHQRGVKMGVCSNKHHDATKALIDKFFPQNVFGCVYGERKGIPRKPNPASVLEIAENLEVSPSETVYVGDSKVDMITGHNAGMLSVGVLWGFRSRKELEENGADILLEHPMELVRKVPFKSAEIYSDGGEK